MCCRLVLPPISSAKRARLHFFFSRKSWTCSPMLFMAQIFGHLLAIKFACYTANYFARGVDHEREDRHRVGARQVR